MFKMDWQRKLNLIKTIWLLAVQIEIYHSSDKSLYNSNLKGMTVKFLEKKPFY